MDGRDVHPGNMVGHQHQAIRTGSAGVPRTCSVMPQRRTASAAQRCTGGAALGLAEARKAQIRRSTTPPGYGPAGAPRRPGHARCLSPCCSFLDAGCGQSGGLRHPVAFGLVGYLPVDHRGTHAPLQAHALEQGVRLPWLTSSCASTAHSTAGSHTHRSATPPGHDWPALACSVPSAWPSTAAGRR